MKKFIYCAALFVLTLGLSCCSKIEDVFNGNDKDAIAPVATTYSAENQEACPLGDLSYLLFGILKQTGVLNYDHVGSLDFVTYTTAAFVINDNSFIENALADYTGDRELNVPEIDFDNYSLVVGSCVVCGPFYFDQRIKKSSSGVKLYVEITDLDVLGMDAVYNFYFAGLYPKLPSGEVEVICWDN